MREELRWPRMYLRLGAGVDADQLCSAFITTLSAVAAISTVAAALGLLRRNGARWRTRTSPEQHVHHRPDPDHARQREDRGAMLHLEW